MGLFDKFLEKKECGICGKELGLLGKTKLQDGYVCKDCARGLSPFFTRARIDRSPDRAAARLAREEPQARRSPLRSSAPVRPQRPYLPRLPVVGFIRSINGETAQSMEHPSQFRERHSGTQQAVVLAAVSLT